MTHKLETEVSGDRIEIVISGLFIPDPGDEEAVSGVVQRTGDVTLDLTDAEFAHVQAVEFIEHLADRLDSEGRPLRIVYRSFPDDHDQTERILEVSGLLERPNVERVPTPPRNADGRRGAYGKD